MKLAVIIPAAGASARYTAALGVPRSKLDEDLGGRTVLQRTIELFHTRPETETVIVAGPADDDAMATFKLRHGDTIALLGATLVTGGLEHRWQTVRNALAAVSDDATHIAVHDAARPGTPPALIDRVLDTAAHFDAVIPAVEVADTVKRVGAHALTSDVRDPIADILGVPAGGGSDAMGSGADTDSSTGPRPVEATLDRSRLVLVQTPQVFAADLLRRAYAADIPAGATDDASLVELLGETVAVVPGDPRNIKITRPDDLPVLRALLGYKAPSDRPTHKRF